LKSKSAWLLVAFTVASVLAAVLIPAFPQPTDYHDFADKRGLLGVANFLDVATNAAFVLAGFAGLAILWMRRSNFERPSECIPYLVFFVGLGLTGVGSAYYHFAPDNERLFWDRLPMTIAFMSLIAAQIAERIDIRAGLALLAPLLVIGMASVVYWIATERTGAGNVVPYAVLQAYAVAAVLLIAVTQRSRYTHGSDIYWVFGAYLAAKVLEHFDREIFAFGRVMSGHSLKHLAAAVAGILVCRMLSRRSLATEPQRPRVRIQ
jgi:hypothetical protein